MLILFLIYPWRKYSLFSIRSFNEVSFLSLEGCTHLTECCIELVRNGEQKKHQQFPRSEEGARIVAFASIDREGGMDDR